MVLGFFCAAGTAGALVDKTGFVRPVRPSVSGSRNLNDENIAASAAALGLAAGVCTGGVLNRTVLHIVTWRGDRFLFTFSAGAGIGFHGIRCTLESEAKNTIDNMRLSKGFISEKDKVLLITSNYHYLRAKVLAKKMGYSVKTIGASAPWKLMLNQLFLEKVSLLQIFVFGV